MAFLKDLYVRYGSRKFLATAAFGGVMPIVFHAFGISDAVVMSAMALAGAYHASNILDKTGGP